MAIPIGISKGLGMLKQIGSKLKRTPESRACIDRKKAQGLSGRQARQECRKIYGSRLGNAGRSLGILPEELKGVSANQILQQLNKKNTPNRFGTVAEPMFAPNGGGGVFVGNGMQTSKAGFNPMFLAVGLLFLPPVRKFLGF